MFRLITRSIPSLVVVATLVLAGCMSRHRASTTSATTTTDLTGRWDYDMNTGARMSLGELWLYRRGDEYTGTVTPRGTNTLPVRSLSVRGSRVSMTVDTPEGPVTFAGAVDASGASLEGTLTYHAGEKFPMTARKRGS